jgi:hypothetical protein
VALAMIGRELGELKASGMGGAVNGLRVGSLQERSRRKKQWARPKQAPDPEKGITGEN